MKASDRVRLRELEMVFSELEDALDASARPWIVVAYLEKLSSDCQDWIEQLEMENRDGDELKQPA